MQLEYMTVDVFTDRRFGGNPLAVVTNAEGLATTQMQSIAAEFNLAETAFVLPPRDPRTRPKSAFSRRAPSFPSRAIRTSAPLSCSRGSARFMAAPSAIRSCSRRKRGSFGSS